ncbi:MAG: hypothetical protein KAI74_04370 [Kiritimatiellae bacterium]|nr:hypothetical protein [Kiritimatiellia bacterium]
MRQDKKQMLTATALVICVLLVGFWEIMSNRSSRAFTAFELNNDDFINFKQSDSSQYLIKTKPVVTTVMEPNIAAFVVKRHDQNDGALVMSRLVHGYNMCDCMKIKGYEVELLADTRAITGVAGSSSLPSQLQVWRLISGSGKISIWVTSMLRAGDFATSSIDVRSMAFPRIGMVEDPNWVPRGFTWSSLRHPVRNTKMMLVAKWNNSRCDILTFLKLKQPAWASDDILTLVSAYSGPAFAKDKEEQVQKDVVEAHLTVMKELQIWRSADTAY